MMQMKEAQQIKRNDENLKKILQIKRNAAVNKKCCKKYYTN